MRAPTNFAGDGDPENWTERNRVRRLRTDQIAWVDFQGASAREWWCQTNRAGFLVDAIGARQRARVFVFSSQAWTAAYHPVCSQIPAKGGLWEAVAASRLIPELQ